ncbi:hypothetical protein BDV38DRAFT_281886 [Aspergillus pseudotamarii]|uniref:Uncharacterized protein n=1 Tax=Aspergillus pseudotamarii TaxID=132259 RepID=A0A5N6SVD3_ASPPS|nr:uncharacterized protein BDV38DRAFT_281886 [Aspergillus pseudotamarii]KAE8138582.1 hypothetical protein BDV38DRAFT_281886 [Aspergillus pseudotamarii]
MPAITAHPSQPPRFEVHQYVKRSDWAQSQPGVILVFVIVFSIGFGVLGIVVHKEWEARRAERAEWTVEEIKDDVRATGSSDIRF